jgi:hypothetical protein
MATDQVSFYDESLKKQIEGSYVSDGKSIHVSSVYGVKSVPYGDLGACIDHHAQVLLVKKLLSELARDSGTEGRSPTSADAKALSRRPGWLGVVGRFRYQSLNAGGRGLTYTPRELSPPKPQSRVSAPRRTRAAGSGGALSARRGSPFRSAVTFAPVAWATMVLRWCAQVSSALRFSFS